MATTIEMKVPDSIDKFSTYLYEFFDLMLHKLDVNSHKDTPSKESLGRIMELLLDEVVEFEDQLKEDKFDLNSLVELADQANFSFLAFVALRKDGVGDDDPKGDSKLG